MKSKGQNLVEYILMVTAVLLVSIYFYTRGPMGQSVNTSINGIVNEINNINSQIQFVSAPTGVGTQTFTITSTGTATETYTISSTDSGTGS